MRNEVVLTLGLLLTPLLAPTAQALTEDEAHSIGVNAYLYFYPLVTMDITRKQLTNQEPGPGSIGGPMNRFANIAEFPAADMRVNESPGGDKEANWLPAPKGPYNMTMRLYAPKSDALTGKWNQPPVTKAAAESTLPQ